MISEPMVRSSQTKHLCCTGIYTISKRTKTSFHLTQEFHQAHPKWFLCLWYIRLKPCTYIASILTLSPNRLKWASTWLSHQWVPLCAPIMISQLIVHSMQTIHLPCVEINTVSKRIETSYHLTHVTYEFHQVCPTWIPRLLRVQRKPCTYLALKLTLSPNRPKRAFTWPTSPRSSIWCAQNDVRAYATFVPNLAPILRRD
jgi:hypothetical protein